jgi:hypothetical protein
MRKITIDSSEAFRNWHNFKRDNTEVLFDKFYLHWNLIAQISSRSLYITNCWYYTQTTKERLNWILKSFWLPTLYQKEGIWYFENWEVFEWEESFNL